MDEQSKSTVPKADETDCKPVSWLGSKDKQPSQESTDTDSAPAHASMVLLEGFTRTVEHVCVSAGIADREELGASLKLISKQLLFRLRGTLHSGCTMNFSSRSRSASARHQRRKPREWCEDTIVMSIIDLGKREGRREKFHASDRGVLNVFGTRRHAILPWFKAIFSVSGRSRVPQR